MKNIKVEVEIIPKNKTYCNADCSYFSYEYWCHLFNCTINPDFDYNDTINYYKRCHQCKMAEKYNEVKDEKNS